MNDPDCNRFDSFFFFTAFDEKPPEIASLVSFVADNPSMNGAILHANGGQKET